MNVRLIIPRRADGGHRDRLWAFVRSYWQRELRSGWEIVEGHHAGPGPFCRAAAINKAAAGAWDVAVILDADVIIDPALVAAGVDRAATTGRMVLPFTSRLSLNQQGTERVLGGYQGSWARWVAGKQNWNVSTCVVVGRALWDETGGFDERFVGWGGEDDAFAAACRALAGPVGRLKGDVWHLWHPVSPWRDHRSPLYRQVRLLAERYVATTDPAAMRGLLDEDRAGDQVVVVCLTNGKRDTLAKTLHSADEMLTGPVGRKVIVADRACIQPPPGWDLVRVSGGGYTRAVTAARDVAVGSGQPWVLWLEDDFVFNRPVDLTAMQAVMDANPQTAQLVLLRQPWYPEEIAAGGVVEAYTNWEARFTQRPGWVEHRAYYSQNPMLTRRSFLAAHMWPQVKGSERAFGDRLFAEEPRTTVGIVGQIGDPPAVTHIGVERGGHGY